MKETNKEILKKALQIVENKLFNQSREFKLSTYKSKNYVSSIIHYRFNLNYLRFNFKLLEFKEKSCIYSWYRKKVYLIHLNILNFFEIKAYKEVSLFRFTLKSYFHYLMYQFENETNSTDLLKIFKKQQEKDKAKIKIFNK